MTNPATRFDVRHSNLGRLAAIAAPLVEVGLLVLLIGGGIELESALSLVVPLWLLSLGHSWFVFGTHYEISDSALLVTHGPWRREFPRTDVLGARLVRTLDRGPAAQIDLAYGRTLLLTPIE